MKRIVVVFLLLCTLLPSCAPASPETQTSLPTTGAPFSSQAPALTSSVAKTSTAAASTAVQTTLRPQPPTSTAPIKIQWNFQVSADQPSLPTKNDGFDALRQNLSRLTMDGSTSLIPMETALRGSLLELSQEDARSQVNHTTTWGSFENLLSGEKNLIFSCPLSSAQREMAKGLSLVEVPLAMEAFVFVVNAKNPVDTLSQQQLKDIYSGRITNWKQVGGPDAPIVAYQRNRDSGSQNYMLDFMGDTPLTDAPTQLRPGTMHGLMEAVAVNDNSLYSIGYSVYAYAADMYQNGEAVKFIRVDGVAPSHQTINDRSYPLLGYNYMIYRQDSPEAALLKQFEEYALSDAAQLALAKARYVPVKRVDFDFATLEPTPYQGTGQGREAREEDLVFYNQATLEYSYLGFTVNGKEYSLPQIVNLADTALQEEINAFVRGSLPEVVEAYPRLLRRLEDSETSLPEYFSPRVQTELKEKNGYLSACVALMINYSHNGMLSDYVTCFESRCAVWDLIEKKRLSLEECFVQGADVDAILNQILTQESSLPYNEWGQLYPMKTEFSSLEKGFDWLQLGIDYLYVDDNNPFFLTGVELECTPDLCVWSYQRDARTCFREETKIYTTVNEYRLRTVTGLTLDGFAIPVLPANKSPYAESINNTVTSYIRKHFSHVQAEIGNDWHGKILGNRYYLVSAESIGKHITYKEYRSFLFDLKTGKEIPWQQLLAKDWKQYASPDQFPLPEDELVCLLNIRGVSDSSNTELSFCMKNTESQGEWPQYFEITVPNQDLRL